MTDRELLELAAKAAGRALKYMTTVNVDGTESEPFIACWSPLTDDGDALRLAVKLGLRIMPYPNGAKVRFLNHILDSCEVDIVDADNVAATRRAITRAAAELGRTIT